MKKKLILMVMVSVLLALCFTGCPAPEEAVQQEAVQKTIVVTDIPSTGGFNYGAVALYSSSDDDEPIAMNLLVPINSGSFRTELLSVKNGKLTRDPFTDEGTYFVYLVIWSDSSSDRTKVVYEGRKLSQSIKDEVTTISFNSFTPYN